MLCVCVCVCVCVYCSKIDKLLKYAEDKWVVVGSSDKLVLTKTEGQVWLALYQLLMSPQCHLKYDLTISKKNHLLKVSPLEPQVLTPSSSSSAEGLSGGTSAGADPCPGRSAALLAAPVTGGPSCSQERTCVRTGVPLL